MLRRLIRSLPTRAGVLGVATCDKGLPAMMMALAGCGDLARMARRPAMSPEWESRTLKNGADVRKFADDARQRLARWRDADD